MQQLSAIDQLFSAKLAEIAIFRRAGQKLSELTALISLLKERELRSVVEIGADRRGNFLALVSNGGD